MAGGEVIMLETELREFEDMDSQLGIVILRRDAERYRWLRDKCTDVDIRAGLAWMSQEFEKLDDAIDAAIDAGVKMGKND
jgi:hypothetical protein